MMSEPKVKVIDLFCGAGGFSAGLQKTGKYDIILGVDNNLKVQDSFIQNHRGAKFIGYDIHKEVPNILRDGRIQCDLVLSSSPCQGFSNASGNRFQIDKNNKNELLARSFHWVDEIRPAIAMMENVEALTTIGSSWESWLHPVKNENLDFMDYLTYLADQIGYKFEYQVLNSKFYGSPSNRSRVFWYLIRDDFDVKPGFPIPKDHDLIAKSKRNMEVLPKTTVKEAFFGLGEPDVYEKNNYQLVLQAPKNKQKSLFSMLEESEPIMQTPGFRMITDKPDAELSKTNPYYDFVFDTDVFHNHVAVFNTDPKVQYLLDRIPAGKTYRSDRNPDDNPDSVYVGAWIVYQEDLSEQERQVIKTVAKIRNNKQIKTRKKAEGFAPLSYLTDRFDIEIIKKLVIDGWLKNSAYCKLTSKGLDVLELESSKDNRSIKKSLSQIQRAILVRQDEYFLERGGLLIQATGLATRSIEKLQREGYIKVNRYEGELELTTKSGYRGKYSKLEYASQSRTLVTDFTSLRELVHPIESRGLSLREGARLMGFPDSFTFYGSFSQIAEQIGNAVIPLQSYYLGDHLYESFFKKIMCEKEVMV